MEFNIKSRSLSSTSLKKTIPLSSKKLIKKDS